MWNQKVRGPNLKKTIKSGLDQVRRGPFEQIKEVNRVGRVTQGRRGAVFVRSDFHDES